MHTLEYIHSKIPENVFKLKILHHFGITSLIVDSPFFDNKIIKLSEEIRIIQVNSENVHDKSYVNKIPFENPEQSVEIIIPTYIKWISKIDHLINYIESNYNTLPEYILYLDGTDTLIINDIIDPQSILDYYKCDVLFNAEPNYMHTGFNLPSAQFYDVLYGESRTKYMELNLEKYGVAHDRSLNAGIFLGKKGFVLKMLKETYDLMTGDASLGFPYGGMDDQCVLRFIQNRHYNEMSVDVYNKYFLFAFPNSIESSEDNWEHFEHFNKKNIKLYNKHGQ